MLDHSDCLSVQCIMAKRFELTDEARRRIAIMRELYEIDKQIHALVKRLRVENEELRTEIQSLRETSKN